MSSTSTMRGPQDPKQIQNQLLMDAIVDGNTEGCEMAISLGADVNQPNKAGVTPLMAAIHATDSKNSQKLEKVVEVLLRHKADFNAKTTLFGTALEKAVTMVNCIGIVKLFLKNKADANALGSHGSPLLHLCANGDIAELLLQHGANLNMKKGKDTPLTHAIRNHNYGLAHFLLKKNAEVRQVDLNLFLHHSQDKEIVAGQQLDPQTSSPDEVKERQLAIEVYQTVVERLRMQESRSQALQTREQTPPPQTQWHDASKPSLPQKELPAGMQQQKPGGDRKP